MSTINVGDIQALADKTYEFCKTMGWSRSWKEGGCYLHLEVSEFIEALRGKGDETPTDEGGDVFFVLFSLLAEHNIEVVDALTSMDRKMNKKLGIANLG